MTRINTNVSSLVAQNRLGQSNNDLNQALTRLSTGLRINTGADDPAGLIASENLRSDITSIRRAISNTDRANQVIATADSALGQVSSLLNDIRGLVTESANSGALSDEQIAANQLQVDSSLEALNRIAQTTTFQGRRLLDGSLDFVTSAGANFTSVSGLNIDQANLGASGEVSVNINVTAAATQAQIDIANFPENQAAASGDLSLDIVTTDAVGSTGDVDLDIITTQAQGATGTTNFSADVVAVQADSGAGANAIQLTGTGAQDQDIQIEAVGGGDLDGLAGNLTVTLIEGAVGASPTVALNGSVIEVTVESGTTTAAQVVSAIDAFDEGTSAGADLDATLVAAQNGGTTLVNAADIGANGTLSGGLNATTEAVLSFELNGGELTADFDVNFALNGASNTGIVIDSSVADEVTVTVEAGAGFTLDDVAAALAADDAFESASFTNGTQVIDTSAADGTAIAAPSVTTISSGGGTDETTETLNFAITGTTAAGATGDLAISFASADIAAGSVNVLGNAADGYTVQLSQNGDVTVAAVEAALTAIDEIETVNTTAPTGVTSISTFSDDGDPDSVDALPGSAQNLTGGVNEESSTEVINVTAAAGSAGNVAITTTISDLSGQGVIASYDATTSGVSLQIDSSINVSLSDITDALEGVLDGDGNALFTDAAVTSAGTASYDATLTTAQTAPEAATLTGGADNGITQDLVIELSGSNGAEVLSFESGTSIAQLVAGINLVSDATGVEARESETTPGTLELVSTAYGSESIVDVNVISEGTGGVFTSELGQGSRSVGVDVIASVNGVSATGDGNSLSINTATLDLSISVEADFTGNIGFDITGGGALFQLGPDVVSNQQARLGIGSVNTAQLGGTSGALFQLGTGGSAELSGNDLDVAAAIVEEAIDQVTSLRGRLGAFQRTTLETNQQALNDTLVNLTAAESSIRDADFAAESAQLTRSQILVQSGTTVLGIANQNPQNVLALLR